MQEVVSPSPLLCSLHVMARAVSTGFPSPTDLPISNAQEATTWFLLTADYLFLLSLAADVIIQRRLGAYYRTFKDKVRLFKPRKPS